MRHDDLLKDANGWFLPYSPRAGCVRGFAVAESGPDKGRIYAAVEVGGVLVSDDDGRSWRLADGSDGKPQMRRDLRGALVETAERLDLESNPAGNIPGKVDCRQQLRGRCTCPPFFPEAGLPLFAKHC